VTDIGELLLGRGKLDLYLEDIRTLWLLHWNLATDSESPLLAWDYLLNRWHDPELVPSVAMKALQKEAQKYEPGLSQVTIQQHLDVFIHTYTQTRGKKGKVQEDNLDCPLVELELIQRIGERESSNGERELVYAFRREVKPEITHELFAYCLMDYWRKRHITESTLNFRDIAYSYNSPGQVFKIPEDDIRAKVEALSEITSNALNYVESAQVPQVHKNRDIDMKDLLKAIYGRSVFHAG
jgi:hypothetical protein